MKRRCQADLTKCIDEVIRTLQCYQKTRRHDIIVLVLVLDVICCAQERRYRGGAEGPWSPRFLSNWAIILQYYKNMPECTKTTSFEKNIKPQIFLALGPPTTPPSLYFWIRPCCVYIICYTLHCFYFPITHFIRLPPRLPWCLTLYAFGIEPRCRNEVPPQLLNRCCAPDNRPLTGSDTHIQPI